MSTFTIPDNLFEDKSLLKSPILIHHHKSGSGSYKQRSVMTRNAVSLVIKGSKTIRFAEAAVETNDREIHFLSSGHSIVSFDIANRDQFESILIFFDDKILSDFCVANASLIDEIRHGEAVEPSRFLCVPKDDFINNFIQSLQLLTQMSKPISDELKQLKLWELLRYLTERHRKGLLAFLNRHQMGPVEKLIRTVVESNINGHLAIDDLAFLCNTSASTFKRHFKKVYDTSPSNWFAEQKMKLAHELLTKRKARPAEIWDKVGFESHSSFTRAFRKQFGMSPTDYLQQMTRKEQLLVAEV